MQFISYKCIALANIYQLPLTKYMKSYVNFDLLLSIKHIHKLDCCIKLRVLPLKFDIIYGL